MNYNREIGRRAGPPRFEPESERTTFPRFDALKRPRPVAFRHRTHDCRPLVQLDAGGGYWAECDCPLSQPKVVLDNGGHAGQ